MEDKFSFTRALNEREFEQSTCELSPKRMLAYQIERAMAREGLSRVEVAQRMNTSRAALNRLLDSENNSVTLKSILSVAEVLNMEIIITLKEKES